MVLVLIEFFFYLQGGVCIHRGCSAAVRPRYRHQLCRGHAFCRRVEEGDVVLWDHTRCPTCAGLWVTTQDPLVDRKVQEEAKAILCLWVAGFSRNSKGKPYLASEEIRQALFPKAPTTAVFKPAPTPPASSEIPVIPVGEAASAGFSDVEMEDATGLGLEFHAPTSPISETLEAELLGPQEEDEEASASGLDTTSVDEASASPIPAGQGKTIFRPLPDNSTTAEPPQSQVLDLILRRLDSMTKVMDEHKRTQEEIKRKVEASNIPRPAPAPQPTPGTSAIPDVPEMSPKNPWRHATTVPRRQGHYFLGDAAGWRPVEDLEFFPNFDQYPNCFLRLKDSASIRDDSIPKETILYEFQRAQDFIVAAAKKAKFSNSGLTAFDRRKATFVAPKELAFPFATKVMVSQIKAYEQGKEPPTLEEFRSTSLMLPNDSDVWKSVEQTFTVEKLDKDIASQQFKENLPILANHLVVAEAEAKKRLARELSNQTLLETSVSQYADIEVFKVLAKSHSATLHDALDSFYKARRACRKHIFTRCKVTHEPNKLLGSSIWGKHLFPEEAVKEVLARAASENKSLAEKWGLQHASQKRRFPPKAGQAFKKPKAPLFLDLAQQGPSTSTQAVAAQSPATNPRYEAQGASHSFRGGRGGKGGKPGKSSRRRAWKRAGKNKGKDSASGTKQ